MAPPTDGESIATIHAALDAGITLLDTGDFYGMGHNEMLIRRGAARPSPRQSVQLSVKFGALRDPGRRLVAAIDSRPGGGEEFPRLHPAAAGRRLHRHLPPGARSIPPCRSRRPSAPSPSMVKAGYVRHIGLSEVGADTIRRAARRAPDRRSADRILADLARHRGRDPADLPRARHRRHRLWRALARPDQRPLVAGARGGRSDFRGAHARASRARISTAISAWSRRCARSPREGRHACAVAIAWVLGAGGDIVPLVGARRRERLAEALGALDVKLTHAQLAAIEGVPARRRRPAHATPRGSMRIMDSEKHARRETGFLRSQKY